VGNNLEKGIGKESFLNCLRRIRNKVYSSSPEVVIDEELEKRLLGNNKKTILYVGIKYDYTRKFWGLSYEHYNFYETLKHMDFSLIYFDYDRLREKFGLAKMSKMLREAVYLYHPDLLFYFHYQDWIEHEVWREISEELPTKTIIYLADDHWRYEETKSLWKIFNLVCSTDSEGVKKRQGEGFSNSFSTQWGCNNHLFRNLNLPKKYDVTFVGRSYGKRKEFVDTIRNHGIDIRTFGLGWKDSGRVPQSELIRIYNQSKISLNISFASKREKIQIKGRDFEAVGCGSLLLTKDTNEIGSYFVPGEEIVTYTDANDALKKLEYYLKNEDERKKIAKKGFERLILEHTMDKRLADIFNAAENLSNKGLKT
jgi:spore maturation protein CgeB